MRSSLRDPYCNLWNLLGMQVRRRLLRELESNWALLSLLLFGMKPPTTPYVGVGIYYVD